MDEGFDVVGHGGLEQIEAGTDIGAHGLFREAFEEGQVFQRRGVEDDVGLNLGDEGVDERRIAEVSEDQVVTGQQCGAFEPELRGVQTGFVPVGHDQPGRVEAEDLAAQLRADGTTGTGDEDDFARDRRGDVVDIGRDRLTADEVFEADVAESAVAQVGDIVGIGLGPCVVGVRELRHDLDLDRPGFEVRGDSGQLVGLQIRDGDDDDACAGAIDLGRDIADRSEHPSAVVAQMPLGRVIVEDAHGDEFIASVLRDHVQGEHPLVARSDDEGRS